MNYRIGNSKRIFEQGKTTELICPCCNKRVEFSVFSNLNTEIIPKLPLVDFKNVYFLICPKCSSIFTVDNARGHSFSKGEKLSIGNFDLKELKEYK